MSRVKTSVEVLIGVSAIVAFCLLPRFADAQTRTLYLQASGGGRIHSFEPGINGCSVQNGVLRADWCEIEIATGTAVMLEAVPDQVSVFSGWAGDCSGTGILCNIALDQDRFVSAAFSSCPGALDWAIGFGGPRDDRALGVVGLPDDSFVVVGTFADTISFGGDPLISAGGSDGFVARFANDGSHLWSLALGGPALDEARAIAVDTAGNLLVAGKIEGIASIGAVQLNSAGDGDIFVAKLSASDGTTQWARRFGGSYDDEAHAIAVDGTSIIVAGRYWGSVDFDLQAVAPAPVDPSWPHSWQDAFVARLDSAGTALWATGAGGPLLDAAVSVVAHGSSGSSPTGMSALTFPPASIDANALPDLGGFTTSAIQIDSSDSFDWAVGLTHGSYTSTKAAIVPLPGGELAFAGYDGFGFRVGRLDVSGGELWSRPLPGPFARSWEDSPTLGRSSSGDLWVGASMREESWSVDGVGPLSTAGSRSDAAIYRLSANDGTVMEAHRLGGSGYEHVRGIFVDSGDDVIAVGYSDRELSGCAGPLSRGGSDDILIFKIASGTPPAATPGGLLPPPDPSTGGGPSLCMAPPANVLPLPGVGPAPSFSEIAGPGPDIGIVSAVSSADLDGDGDEDFLHTGAAGDFPDDEIVVWRNEGAGVFVVDHGTILPEAIPLDYAANTRIGVLDADNDLDDDLVLANVGYDRAPWPGEENVLLTQDQGTLVDSRFDGLPLDHEMNFRLAHADIDCDGDQDLFFGSESLLLGDGQGSFEISTPRRTPDISTWSNVTFCDVDRDGDPDLIVGTVVDVDRDRLALNDGRGYFSYPAAEAFPQHPDARETERIECADMTNDGYPDVLAIYGTGGGAGPLSGPGFFVNNGDGTFSDASSGIVPSVGGWGWLTLEDINSDGWIDVLLHARNGVPFPALAAIAMINQGDSTFVEHAIDEDNSAETRLQPILADDDVHLDLVLIRQAGSVDNEAVLVNQLLSAPGFFRLQTTDLNVDESEPFASVGVVRESGTEGAVSVSFRTVASSALPGEDYVATTGVILFADGEGGSQTFEIPILVDSVPEGEEILWIELFGPTHGSRLSRPSRAGLRIDDGLIFHDGFESGSTSDWSNQAP